MKMMKMMKMKDDDDDDAKMYWGVCGLWCVVGRG
jgi:hypothetical protein